jgi:hypothetical protein
MGLDLHQRPFLREAQDHLGQHVLGEVLRQAEPDRRRRARPQRRRGLVVERDDAPRIGEQRIARLGRHQAAAALPEQRLAGLLLQLLQLHADRRLRAPQPRRRAGEAAELGAGDDHAQGGDVEGGPHGSTFLKYRFRHI